MQDSLYLAWQYLRYNRLRTIILIACITLVSVLPISLNLLLKASEKQLMARAQQTPLLLGKIGSDLDLTINSLYFTAEPPEDISMEEVENIKGTKLAKSIPLYLKFQARNHPIVGTTLDYFEFRQLRSKIGNYFALLGDCVLGAAVAERLNLKHGDHLISSPEALFDIGGIYPLKMKVVGVLERSFTADDEAVFTDIKTAWIIRGLGHGHQDLEKTGTPDVILNREKGKITANAKLKQYTEITPDNIDSFHFHGQPQTFPLTAVIVVPDNQKSETLLRGRYEAQSNNRSLVKPQLVIEELLIEIFKIRDLLNVIFALVIAATLIAIILIFNLSLRLRQREIETSFMLGCSKNAIARLITAEISIILVISLLLTGVITVGFSHFKQPITRTLIS